MVKVLLGVTSSISCYKMLDVVNELTKNNNEVTVMMSHNATKFIQPLAFQTLSKNKVYLDTMVEYNEQIINHIELAKNCDKFLIAPATANIIGKLANGIADDFISTVALAIPNTTKKYIAPAMNTNMWNNPAVQRNIAQLKQDGYIIINPKEGLLACGDKGIGALADNDKIIKEIT